MPSTLANNYDLLADYKRVIKNNNDMSIFYILYQGIILIFTIIGPGMAFTLLITATGTFLDSIVTTETFLPSIIINIILLLMFIIVCFVGKSDTQIGFAQILTVIYALLPEYTLFSLACRT